LEEKELAVLKGTWQVSFQPDRGAPPTASFDELNSFTSSSDQGIKYFSGTASYSKTIQVEQSWLADKSTIWIDLGDVKNLAEVLVNGKSLGIVWKKPFRVDLTGTLKTGENKIEIRVTNLWVNRLIGDTQPGAKKITFTTMAFYQPNSPLQPSGLMGPVRIIAASK
jgi:beta-galactosidase/beta-glucuronidase